MDVTKDPENTGSRNKDVWQVGFAKYKQLGVGGKMNLPPHGKEIFTDAVSSILHRMVRSFLHGTVNRILQIT